MSAKQVRKKSAAYSIAPEASLKLDTLGDVRGEMARVYQLALSGEIELEKMTKLIYTLKELRSCIEIDLLDEAPRRLEELRSWVEGRTK